MMVWCFLELTGHGAGVAREPRVRHPGDLGRNEAARAGSAGPTSPPCTPGPPAVTARPSRRSAHGERRQLDEALDEPMGNHNGMTRRAARLGRSCGLSARSGSGIGLPYRPVGWTIRR
jgi:hypothetical protein